MSRLRKSAYPEATLTLDFGGSGTKGIVQIRGGTPHPLYMEPNAIAANRASLVEKTQNNLCNAYPENLAWVGVDSEYRAVGYLAASSYSATAELRPRKYEQALYKTLAAVWVIKQKYKLSSEFDLSLALLLPPGEFEDSSLLKPMLKEALASYDTPTGQLQVNLTHYECFPEGGGIYMMYCKNKGADIKRQVIAMVMIGYRNASVLLSRRGVLDKGRTTNLGMARLVDLAMSRTAGNGDGDSGDNQPTKFDSQLMVDWNGLIPHLDVLRELLVSEVEPEQETFSNEEIEPEQPDKLEAAAFSIPVQAQLTPNEEFAGTKRVKVQNALIETVLSEYEEREAIEFLLPPFGTVTVHAEDEYFVLRSDPDGQTILTATLDGEVMDELSLADAVKFDEVLQQSEVEAARWLTDGDDRGIDNTLLERERKQSKGIEHGD